MALGVYDGWLFLTFTVFLEPEFGHLSQLDAVMTHYTGIPRSPWILLLLCVMLRYTGHQGKMLLMLLTIPLLKAIGYLLSGLENSHVAVWTQLAIQGLLALGHFVTTRRMIYNRLVYYSMLMGAAAFQPPFQPLYAHLLHAMTLLLAFQGKAPYRLLLLCLMALVSLSSIVIPHLVSKPETLLASAHGPTGVIQVLHVPSMDIKVLRAGHSLIGGEYSNGDCIWGSFYFHEFAHWALPATANTAVAIGIGSGITAKSLSLLNYTVHAVDIDPVVAQMAQSHFNVKAIWHIQDGAAYLESLADRSIDLLCHDVFTGGSVPSHLYTHAFFEMAAQKLKTAGMLTINIVTHISTGKDGALRLLLGQLRPHFSHIRAFRDGTIDDSEVHNVVLICAQHPIRFRKGHGLGSEMRQYFIHHLLDFEWPLPQDTARPNASLDQLTFDQQYDHWSIMNKMVSPAAWMLYE